MDFSKLIEILPMEYKAHIERFDMGFIEQSVRKRMEVHKISSPGEYARLVESLPGEAEVFYQSLHISFSEFFRNPLTFAFLEQVVIPELMQDKDRREIRVWSAACAAGEEAYSIAMILEDAVGQEPKGVSFRVFGSDISASALAVAKKGQYNSTTISKVRMDQFRNYFLPAGSGFSVIPEIKANLSFSYFDLLSDTGFCPPESIYGGFDLVFCANLLFYYNEASRGVIMKKVRECMSKGAYLVTGEVERKLMEDYGFREYGTCSAVFKKRKY